MVGKRRPGVTDESDGAGVAETGVAVNVGGSARTTALANVSAIVIDRTACDFTAVLAAHQEGCWPLYQASRGRECRSGTGRRRTSYNQLRRPAKRPAGLGCKPLNVLSAQPTPVASNDFGTSLFLKNERLRSKHPRHPRPGPP